MASGESGRPSIMPVSPIVADAAALLALANELTETVKRNPSNPASMLAAMVLLYHVKDWVRPKDDDKFFEHCPFAQALSEIANGTKHFEVHNAKLVSDPHVSGIRLEEGYSGMLGGAPVGATPLGGGTPDQLWIYTRRLKTETEQGYWPATILVEVIEWWRRQLGLPPT